MSRQSETGALGEEYTAAYLAGQGFTLAARHFKRAEGEIDLVAMGKGLVLFVEVKTRSAGALYPAAYAVTTAERGRVLHFTYLENAF